VLPVTSSGVHGSVGTKIKVKVDGVDTDIYPNPQTGTLIGDVLIQGSIPSTEFSNDKIYYQVGGDLTVKKGGTDYVIQNEWFTELNDASGTISNIGISGGFLSGTGVVEPEASTNVTGYWMSQTDKWNFTFTIDTIALKNANKLYQTPGTTAPNLKTVNVYVVSIDTAGNKNVGVYPINLDTDTDKPVVQILTPEEVAGFVDLGGSFTISGNAIDNNNMMYDVYMQVEVVDGNYVDDVLVHNSTSAVFDGTSTVSAGIGPAGQSFLDDGNGIPEVSEFTGGVTSYFANRTAWYKVNYNSATGGWKIKLNGDGEFFNQNLENYYSTGHIFNASDKAVLKVRVMAIDSKDGNGILSTGVSGSVIGNYKETTIRIDGDNPGISLDVFPDANTYTSGLIPVTVTFTDNVSVASYSLYAGSKKIFDHVTSAGWTVTTEPASAPFTSVKLVGSIDSSTLDTQVVFRLDVEDDGTRTSSMMRTVYVDNDEPTDVLLGVLQPSEITSDPPTLYLRPESSYLRISSTEATLAGRASDVVGGIEGSGIKYVVLYLTKEAGGKTYIYNTEKRDAFDKTIRIRDTDGTELTNQISVNKYFGGSYSTGSIYFPEASLNAIKPNKDAVGNKLDPTSYVVIDANAGNEDGDGDYYRENLKANKAWSVMLDSTKINDGLYTVNYLVVDNAGNYPPVVQNIVLATDINADAVLDHNAFGSGGDEDFAYPLKTDTTVDATDFTVVNNRLVIRVNRSGTTGTDPLTYYLEYPSGATPLSNSDGIFDVPTFPGDGPNITYKVWITDSVEPDEGISLKSEEVIITLNVDNDDGEDPDAWIYPLNTIKETVALRALTDVSGNFINSTLGSLYIASVTPKVVQGHIEPRANSMYDNATIADPDVSGEIILRGKAYDNQRITSIALRINGAAPVTIIDMNTDTKRLKVAAGMETLVRVADKIGLDGHYAEWSYIWNTATVPGVALNNVEVKVIATDANPSAPNTNADVPYIDEAVPYNLSTYDVVPYITAITTTNRIASGLKNDNIRSSSGKYSVIWGLSDTFITVDGFNLATAANSARIVDATEVIGTVTGTTGTAINNSAGVYPYKQITVSQNSSVSGYLELFVNNIRTVNNYNQNTLESNQEPNLVTRNLLLNDDRYLRFFKMNTTDVKNGYYPTMIMEGDDPVFGYVNLSGGPNSNVGIEGPVDNGGAGTYQYSHAMPQRGKFQAGIGANTATTLTKEYLIKASIWDQMGMARDDSGRFIHATSYNRDGASMSVIYDRYAELYAQGMGWGSGTGYSGYTGNWSDNGTNNALTLEGVNYGGSLQLGRFQYPKLIAKGNSRTDHAKIFMLYYDANTATNDLIFRNFQIGTNAGTRSIRLSTIGTATDGVAYSQRTNLVENDNGAGRITAASNASNHFAFDVTGSAATGYRVVMVYYNESDGRLYLRYSNNLLDCAKPTDPVAWTTSPVVFPAYVGNYVSMKIDSLGGIHISALDTSDSDLAYFYLPAYNSSSAALKHVTVDASFSVGNWTQIKLREVSGEIIPYIAYYNSSETGSRDSIKLAYYNERKADGSPDGVDSDVLAGVDDDGYATGYWEYMTVPAITPPQGGNTNFQNVCLDFDSAGRPVVGYLGTNLEFGKWLNE
jgi:hypothetical protein